MSKSSTATSQKLPPQLSSKSAWARGPPQPSATTASSRSQSPAPTPTTPSTPNPASSAFHGTHSRRPSTLGQGVPIKEGVSVPRSIAASKPGSAVTFGSIDDAAAPISSSPASAPVVKPGAVSSFGSVAVQNGASVPASKSAMTNRPPSASSSTTAVSAAAASSTTAPSSSPSPAPKISKKDIAKMFQGSSAPSPPQPSSEVSSSPVTRPPSLPPTAHQSGGGYIPPPYQPGGSNLRPQPPNGSPSGAPPRSPSYPRQPMVNGQNGSVAARPQSGPTSAPGAIPPAMPSPRMTPHAPPGGQPAAMPPPQQVPWPGGYAGGYYYPQYSGMPPESMYQYQPAWGPQQMQPHHPHQQPPHHGPVPPGPPVPGLPMSPRNPQPPLQPPGTPTLNHAAPIPSHIPPPHIPPPSVTSPPPTPSSANGAAPRLNSSASAFVPSKKSSASISFKTADGKDVDLGQLRKGGQSPSTAPVVSPPPVMKPVESKRTSVRIESPEQKERRMAEQRQAEEAEKAEKARVEREAKEAKEAQEKAEREKKEEEERKAREAKEAKEREEREKREAEEREKAEAERKKREEEEAAERARVEAEDKKRREDEAREKARLDEERVKKEAEERERKENEERERKEAEDKARREAEDKLAEEAKAKDAAVEEKEEGEIVEEKPAASAGKDLRVNTAVPSTEARRRPGPLDLKNISSVVTPSLPSALKTARIIEDLGSVAYPEGIKSPKIELNVNAAKGKFRYDRDFLLQFMAVCKEKPDNLPPLDAIGLEPSDQTFGMTRGGSSRSRVASLQTPTNRNSGIGLGFVPSSLGKAAGGSFAMGNFSTTASKLSSEERFAMSSGRSASAAGMPAAAPGRPPPMARTASQGGPNDRRRTRSSRGQTRGDNPRGQGAPPNHPSQAPSNMAPPFEPVAPLEQSANRWVAGSTKRGGTVDVDSPEMVDRKVKALLNKLTMERFDSISDQIIGWANKSEKEKNGQTLIQVIRLVFEKATDEATFSEMYARLCRKMMEQISTKVQDDGILNAEGKPFAGGQLFRKYLLNRCQEDFERGWNQKETTAAAAAKKATEDQAVKDAAEKEKDSGKEEEVALYSDEYYAAAKAKRRGLGLIRFIGELFKLQMLTERIMHECIKKLLGNVENPEEEEIESLCKLLSTVGQLLDTQKARAHMDVYFSRMKELTKSKNVTSRMTFMLQDVIELREHRWIPRNQVAAPTTIAQIHEKAAKEKAQADKDAASRQSTMSRGGSRRGDHRPESIIGPDGWAVAGSSSTQRPPPKAGDLSNFGKISKAAPVTNFGPSSVFSKSTKETKSREAPPSRVASSRNMFDMLNSADAASEPPMSKGSRPPSRKPSADFTQTGIPEAPPQRKRLNLLPRTKPVEESKPESGDDAEDDDDAEEEQAAGPSMSEDEAKRKIDEDIKELFQLRSIDESESYFSSLPADYWWIFVDKLVNKGIDGKAADIPLVGDVLRRATEKELVSADALEQGFNGLAEIIDDIAIDVPKAFNNMADWLKAAGLDKDDERRNRIAAKVPESGEKLLSLLEA